MKSSSESGSMSDSFDDSDDSAPLGTYSSDSSSSFDSDSDDYDDSGFMSPGSPTEGYIVDRDMYPHEWDSDMSMVSPNYSDSHTAFEVENLWPEVDSSGVS